MSGGKSQSQARGEQRIAGFQREAMADLIGQAQGIAGQQAGFGGELAAQIGGLIGQGQGFLGNLAGLAGGTSQGQQSLAQFSSGAATQAGITNLGQQLARNLQQNILPQIGGAAMGAGAFGSSRQGIAEGLALQGAQQAFGTGAAQLLSAGNQQQLQAAQLLNQGQLMGAQAGLGGLGQLLGLGQAQGAAPFATLQQLQGLIGPAVVEGRTSSDAKSVQGGAF